MAPYKLSNWQNDNYFTQKDNFDHLGEIDVILSIKSFYNLQDFKTIHSKNKKQKYKESKISKHSTELGTKISI